MVYTTACYVKAMLLAIREEKNCVVCINILALIGLKTMIQHDRSRVSTFVLNIEEMNKCLKEIQENKTYSITEL